MYIYTSDHSPENRLWSPLSSSSPGSSASMLLHCNFFRISHKWNQTEAPLESSWFHRRSIRLSVVCLVAPFNCRVVFQRSLLSLSCHHRCRKPGGFKLAGICFLTVSEAESYTSRYQQGRQLPCFSLVPGCFLGCRDSIPFPATAVTWSSHGRSC